jgi:5-deoxy-glucuronate isomerase
MPQSLLIPSQDRGGAGVFASVTAQEAGWEHLNMTARRLNTGERFTGQSGNSEMAHVLLGGRAHVRFTGGEFLNIGRRPHVFGGMPWAVYLPPGLDYEFEALTDGFEVASCWVKAEAQYPARLVTPQDCPVELRGGENASRQINGILPPGFPCQRIVAVEVYTPGGNWSSYPPHKHDVHRTGADGGLLEADLEEIYFYKIDRSEGYAYQRVYTDDRRLDALMLARQHDMVLVPEGYHPVVSAHGYTTWYLNFLAGSAQSLANSDDPAYSWVKANWRALDARLPIVSLEMEP